MADAMLQRKNMVETQVRPSDITDRRIIRAMLEVQREAFVPAASSAIAYGDLDIPLTSGARANGSAPRSLLAARVFAKLIQLCDIESHDDVLIIGAGMGYSAAVVAKLAKSVIALEQDEALAAAARTALASECAQSVEVITGPLTAGAVAKAPFDVIIIEGAVSHVPQALLDQLGPQGRLAAVVSRGVGGKATLWRRSADCFDASDAFDAAAPLLPGFGAQPKFIF